MLDSARSHAAAPMTIGFALAPRFTQMAFVSAVETLRLANHVLGRQAYAWKAFSEDGAPVAASNGMATAVDGAFATMDASILVVCGGLDIQATNHHALMQRLRKLATRGVTLGALCTGPYVLAKAGLLDGHRCTIHWENLPSFREEFPQLQVTQELYEIDRGRMTCAGGTAAIDMFLSLIERREGGDVAAQVTDELIHHRMRDKGERQRMDLRARIGVAHPKLIAIIGQMEKRLENPASCAQLAREAGLSARQLERLFQKYIGDSPTRYYLQLRLDRARFLLMQTSMPILSVGLACGFVSASHFSKCYSEHFRKTPSEERKRVAPRKARAGAD